MHSTGSVYTSLVLVLLASATTLTWHVVLAQSERDTLTVVFLDVGQGDAIFIEAPNGTQVLVDGGKGAHVLRGLGRHMPWFDRTIDVVVATHPDIDHIGGLPQVFGRYEVDVFLESGARDDGADQAALYTAVKNEGLDAVQVREGMSLMLDQDVSITFLYPRTDVTHLEANRSSVVAQLTYGDTSFMLTGDSPIEIEKHLVDVHADALKSDVLKLGHHGSRTSSSRLFIGYVSPLYGIVSAGCNNRYGHPHREVIDTLQQHDVEVLRTCDQGDIVFESDGATIRYVR